MFLRRYRRTKDGKVHTYYALVESVRTDAGPRQRVVAHLGELNHDQERRWQRTVVFYNRHGDWFGWACVGVTTIWLVTRFSEQKRKTAKNTPK